MIRLVLLPLLFAAAPALAAPVAQAAFAPGTTVPAKIVVNETLWKCSGASCSGQSETRAVALQKACATLARSIGPVTALSAGDVILAPAAITKCNAKGGHGPAEVATK